MTACMLHQKNSSCSIGMLYLKRIFQWHFQNLSLSLKNIPLQFNTALSSSYTLTIIFLEQECLITPSACRANPSPLIRKFRPRPTPLFSTGDGNFFYRCSSYFLSLRQRRKVSVTPSFCTCICEPPLSLVSVPRPFLLILETIWSSWLMSNETLGSSQVSAFKSISISTNT